MLVGTRIIYQGKETLIANVWAQGRHRKYILADGREFMVEPGHEHELIDRGEIQVLSNNSPLKEVVTKAEDVLAKKSADERAKIDQRAKELINEETIRREKSKPKFNWGGGDHNHE